MKQILHLCTVTCSAVVILALSAQADVATNGDEIAFRSIGGTSYVIHSYTTVGDSSFTPPEPVNDTLTVEYLVIGGGGSGGKATAGTTQGNGGGGAGGYRSSVIGELSGANSAAEPVLSLSHGTPYDVTVGGGGEINKNGDASSFDTIEALGAGMAGTEPETKMTLLIPQEAPAVRVEELIPLVGWWMAAPERPGRACAVETGFQPALPGLRAAVAPVKPAAILHWAETTRTEVLGGMVFNRISPAS